MDTLSFGSPDDPPRARLPLPGWLRVGAGISAVCAMATGVFLASSARVGHRAATPPPSAVHAALLAGVPGKVPSVGLLVGGDHLWRLNGGRLELVNGALVSNLSRLGSDVVVRQLLAVHSGAVALVANSTPAGRDIGNVVLVPASGGALRLLAHANEIAVTPDGEHVWVQQSGTPLGRGPKDNPTWFIDLAGRTLSPVLRLPGALLVAATSQGALTQTENGLHIVTPTGQVTPLPLPADVLFVEAAGDRVVYVSQDCSAQCAAYVLDLRTRRTVAVGLPPRQAFAGVPQPNGFDPTGRRLVLTLIGLNSAGRPIDEDLFVLDMVTKTVSHVPGALVPRPAGLLVTGSWDSTGRLWVLATDILESQLAYWPGSGPLRTLPVIPGGAASVTVLDAAPR